MAVRAWGQVIIQNDMPAEPPVRVGTIWCEEDTGKTWRCTSISPYSFQEIGTGGGGGGAPTDAKYLVLEANAGLSQERVLTEGAGISFVDNGPGSTLEISAAGGGGNGYFPQGW